MEQILIRNLPAGTKSILRAQAEAHHRSLEAEARAILTAGLTGRTVTLVDAITTDDRSVIDFEPERLQLTARVPEL